MVRVIPLAPDPMISPPSGSSSLSSENNFTGDGVAAVVVSSWDP